MTDSSTKNAEEEQNQLKLYKKHHQIISDLEKLFSAKQEIVKNLASVLAEDEK